MRWGHARERERGGRREGGEKGEEGVEGERGRGREQGGTLIQAYEYKHQLACDMDTARRAR